MSSAHASVCYNLWLLDCLNTATDLPAPLIGLAYISLPMLRRRMREKLERRDRSQRVVLDLHGCLVVRKRDRLLVHMLKASFWSETTPGTMNYSAVHLLKRLTSRCLMRFTDIGTALTISSSRLCHSRHIRILSRVLLAHLVLTCTFDRSHVMCMSFYRVCHPATTLVESTVVQKHIQADYLCITLAQRNLEILNQSLVLFVQANICICTALNWFSL